MMLLMEVATSLSEWDSAAFETAVLTKTSAAEMKEADARAFADFLLPMLEWKPGKRATAKEILKHPWL